MKKPHVHAEVIKAWADGATIQFWDRVNKEWDNVFDNNPSWAETEKYRVKPEVKSDAELLWVAFGGASESFHNIGKDSFVRQKYEKAAIEFSRLKQEQDNV